MLRYSVTGPLLFLGDLLPARGFRVGVHGRHNVVVNLEAAILSDTDGTEKRGNILLQGDPLEPESFLGQGPVLASLANNHSSDFGSSGLAQTLASLRACGSIPFGVEEESEGVGGDLLLDVEGVSVGMISLVDPETFGGGVPRGGFPRPAIFNEQTLRSGVDGLRSAGADLIVVVMHWGGEEVSWPDPAMRGLASLASELGVDLVVGHHSHVRLPWEKIGKTWVFYGLGNLFMPDLDAPVRGSRIRYQKKQHVWNRRSLAVRLYPRTPSRIEVAQMLQRGNQTRQVSAWRAATARELPGGPLGDGVYHALYVAGKLRALFGAAARNPRPPNLGHLREILRILVRRNRG